LIDTTPLEDLGHANHGWLDARHHFSFANYYDPACMGFSKLRVWNDDPHKDMKIITYIRKGAISHEDNLGNAGVSHALEAGRRAYIVAVVGKVLINGL
jgi:redox-sensitive bicupin YhaK (pirin superfamily)